MKELLKTLLNAISSGHASLHRFHLLIGAGFRHKSISLSQKSGRYGIYLRRNWYMQTLKKCGDNLIVGFGSHIVYRSVEIGNNCAIEENCVVSNCSIGDDVILAANVSIMSGAHHHPVDDLSLKFRDHVNPLSRTYLKIETRCPERVPAHDTEQPSRVFSAKFNHSRGAWLYAARPIFSKIDFEIGSRVRLGDNIWVGTHAVIMSDIGSGAVVAAGASVTKPVAENAIVAGSPAKLIQYRGQAARSVNRA